MKIFNQKFTHIKTSLSIAIAALFLLSCKSSEPIVSSVSNTSDRTIMSTSASNFSASSGYVRNSAIYNKVNLASGYSYVANNIAQERLGGVGQKIGVIEVLHNASYMPLAATSYAANIDSVYAYSGDSISASSFISTSSETKPNIIRDLSGDHGIGVMSLIAGARGDKTYGTSYSDTNDKKYTAFNRLYSNTTTASNQSINGVAFNSKIIYVGGSGSDLNTSTAIPNIVNFMAAKGSRVVNMSFADGDYTTKQTDKTYNSTLANNLSDIVQKKSVIMVVSGGNVADGTKTEFKYLQYPAAYSATVNGTPNAAGESTNLGAMLAVVSTTYSGSTISTTSTICGSNIFCLAAPGTLASNATTYSTVSSNEYLYNGNYYKPITFTATGNSFETSAIQGVDGKIYIEGKVYVNLTNAKANSGSSASSIYSSVLDTGVITEILTSANGTSYAAPIVSGIAANLSAAFPRMTSYDIAAFMLKYSNPNGTTSRTQGQWNTALLDQNIGWGIVDFAATAKAIDESTFGYNPKNAISSASVSYTAISASPVIGNSVKSINNALANVVFTDAFGYSFKQALDYKSYSQNGYGGYTNQYTGNSGYASGVSNFYSNFFASALQGSNSQAGNLSLTSGTSVSFNLNNRYQNQGSLVNINENSLTKGFAALAPSQNPYNTTGQSFSIGQNFGNVNFIYAKNGAASNTPSAFMSLASLSSLSNIYKASYNVSGNMQFGLTNAQFQPVGQSIIGEFSNSNFTRRVSEMSLEYKNKTSNSSYNLTIGSLNERGAFLTTLTGGAFYVNGANTTYTDVNINQNLGKNFALDFSTSIGITKVSANQNLIFSSFSNLITTSHDIGIKKSDFANFNKNFDSSLRFGLKMPISVTSGNVSVFDGSNYNNVSLAQSARQLDYQLTYSLTNKTSPLNVYFNIIHSQNFANLKGVSNNYAILTIRKSAF